VSAAHPEHRWTRPAFTVAHAEKAPPAKGAMDAGEAVFPHVSVIACAVLLLELAWIGISLLCWWWSEMNAW
jgi:hypothetical protein